jgi:hypothetical protein
MTTQEKAQELFNKFADIEHFGVYGEYDGTWEWSSSLWRQQAKQCALISVDEILNNKELLNHLDLEWWNEVKQEINKI